MDNDYKKKKKSPKERFLLVIGILFFGIYLFMGLAIIFMTSLPLAMERKYRVALGVVLIVYALLRFLRLFKSNTSEE
ncbi:MAG: hypothetical protein EOP06_13535 [Proteobacteria bacterium]|nr:MAG: hypothetical protein EOP06_13535 [Pseudomonadota bacterium]